MDFIQDHNAVLREHRICEDLSEQTAVRHVLHHGALAQTQTPFSRLFTTTTKYIAFPTRHGVVFASHLWRAVIEAYLVAHLSTQSALHLLGDPLGHRDGSHPAGLRDANFAIFAKACTETRGTRFGTTEQWPQPRPNLRQLLSRTCLMKVLRELRGFPAAGLTGDSQKSAVFDGQNQFVFVPIDGQLFGLVFFRVQPRRLGHNWQLVSLPVDTCEELNWQVNHAEHGVVGVWTS